MARDRAKISCGDIVRTAVGSGIDEVDTLSPLMEAIIVPAMAEAERDYFSRLDRISVADLCVKTQEALEEIPGLLEPA